MIKILNFAWKNLRVNRVRTLLTVVGVAVAIFIFCFFQSVKSTMDDLVAQAGEMNNLVVMQDTIW